MLSWRAEPGGDEEGTELVAVQRDGMRLIVDPRPPDVGGRGMFEELFLLKFRPFHDRRMVVR